MLKKLLLGTAVAVAVFLGWVALRPSHYRVERSAVVKAAPQAVYAIVSDLGRWDDWSPWTALDPSVKKEVAGAPGAPGASYHWSGNDQVGEGRMTLLEASAPARVAYRLEFLRPRQSAARTEFALAPDGAGTRVSWSMAGDLGYAEKLFALFFDFEAAISRDFDRGLASLGELAEGGGRR